MRGGQAIVFAPLFLLVSAKQTNRVSPKNLIASLSLEHRDTKTQSHRAIPFPKSVVPLTFITNSSFASSFLGEFRSYLRKLNL